MSEEMLVPGERAKTPGEMLAEELLKSEGGPAEGRMAGALNAVFKKLGLPTGVESDDVREGLLSGLRSELHEKRDGSPLDRYLQAIEHPGNSLFGRLGAAAEIATNPMEMLRTVTRAGPEVAELLIQDVAALRDPARYRAMESEVLQRGAGQYGAGVGSEEDLRGVAAKMASGESVDSVDEYRVLARVRGGGMGLVVDKIADQRMLDLANGFAEKDGGDRLKATGDHLATDQLGVDLERLTSGREASSAKLDQVARDFERVNKMPPLEVIKSTLGALKGDGPKVPEETAVESWKGPAAQTLGSERPAVAGSVLIKNGVSLKAALQGAREDAPQALMLRMDGVSKIRADGRLMEELERADIKDLRKLYDATVSYRDENRSELMQTESGRLKHDGFEMARRVVGETLIKNGGLEKEAFYKQGAAMVSERGKSLPEEERADIGNNMQDGRRSLNEVLAHMGDLGRHRQSGARIGADLVQTVTRSH